MALILHGTFLPETQQFALWAESSDPLKRKGRQPKIPYHPFCASPEALADWALKLADHIAPEPDAWTIWLPSSAAQPQPSPEMAATGAVEIITSGENGAALQLRSWRTDGITLSILDTVDLLLALDLRTAVGRDLQFWRAAALHALSLVAGQQVVPALERDGLRLRASWRPQPEAPENIKALAEQMPPLCRALTEAPEAALAPRDLLNGFIAAVVDKITREAAQAFKPKVPRGLGGAWLTALTSERGILKISGTEADDLYKAWEAWVGQSSVAGNAAFRIAFRLEAPEADGENARWTLHYLLQAVDDPSLIVSAGEIWRQSSSYLAQRFDNPQERLLAGLGFAGRLFEPIKASLYSPVPEKAEFDTTVAYTFLKEVAPLLQSSGFRVLLPRWWGGKTERLTTKATVKSSKTTGKTHLSLDTLVHYEWQVMLGGQPISREEFARLAALKQPLVQIRGQWVTLDPDQVAAGLKFFEKSEGEIPLGDALRLGLGGENTLDGAPVQSAQTTGWLKSLLNTLQTPEKIETLDPPAGLHTDLRPYQQRGYSWLAFMRRYGLGACLADDMGLGKTVSAISLILHERTQAKTTAPALVVCPTSVVGNWRREVNRFAPDLKVHTHLGADRATGDGFAARLKGVDIVLTSYPLLARDRETIEAVEWSTVILDEAQNIKNNSTKQAQAARALKAANRVALTGTPVENRLTELWSIMNFLNPGYLGNETTFKKRFANPIERLGDKDAAKRLKQLTAPFILRRLKTDPKVISDLPEKLEMKVYCTLTTEQGTLYEAVVRDIMERIEQADDEGNPMARRGLVLSMLMQLKQVCNHPAHYLKDGSALSERSGKLSRLTEMLEEVYAAGDRALVFTQFAEMGEMLCQHLRDTFYDEPLFLHGGTRVPDREEMIRRFQAEKGPTVFILSLKAGGVGLNLTRANHVFHFDRWWNPAVENQATDRAFRIGQTRNVQVHKYVCAGTLEEKIDEMIESKKALAESIVGADEGWLTELSTSDLRELVKLREVAD